MDKYISNSIIDTKAFGKRLAKVLNKGDVIVLNGDLGAGKTALVTGVASFWDKENEVASPTFTIVNEIVLKENLSLFHFDVYRLEDEDEFYAIGGEEYFEKGITFMEWGNNIKNALPNDYLEIDIRKNSKDENIRVFYLIPHGTHYEKLVDDLDLKSYDDIEIPLSEEDLEYEKAKEIINHRQGVLPGINYNHPIVTDSNEETIIDEKDVPWELLDAEDANPDDEPSKTD